MNVVEPPVAIYVPVYVSHCVAWSRVSVFVTFVAITSDFSPTLSPCPLETVRVMGTTVRVPSAAIITTRMRSTYSSVRLACLSETV